jgi:hypothetical protein
MEDKQMKKIISTIAAVSLMVVFSSAPAHADRKTMEGFLLGTGVAILGTAIIHGINKDNKPVYQTSYSDHRTDRYNRHHRKDRHRPYKKYRHNHRRGHWEIEHVWVEPVYEKKWNPGHYNRHGKWVSGRYERFEICKGYWKKERVWVRY